MKKVIALCLGAAILSATFSSFALVNYEDRNERKFKTISGTGFIDYAPYGFTEHPNELIRGKFSTVWQPMIDELLKDKALEFEFDLRKRTDKDSVQATKGGKIDIFLGAYNETKLYEGLELIFPSIISNPATIFMLPNRVNDIKEIDDLKKLKGVRLSTEIFTDFVERQLKQYDIETVNTPYDLFERLFTKKVDYILVTQYVGIIESIKLGLRGQVSEARQTLWKMPMFIGISKVSPNRRFLVRRFTQLSTDPKMQEAIKNNLHKIIEDFEKKYEGTVPPTFGLEKGLPIENSHPDPTAEKAQNEQISASATDSATEPKGNQNTIEEEKHSPER